MYLVDNQNITDPRMNLAVEEYLLRQITIEEPLLLFYINEPSVIIGRNQNTVEEIDPDYIEEHGIHVVRRLSGGGAVYHDLGNLNFSFVTAGTERLHDFARFADPVMRALRRLGLDVELRGKSDVYAAGKKISGNAQYASAGRMFSHGTLLFDTNLEHMLKALNPRKAEIKSNAVKSVRNFVANIRELVHEDLDIMTLKEALTQEVFGSSQAPEYSLDDEDWSRIHRISAERYQKWDWNFGRSPKFNFRKSGVFGAGKVDVLLQVVHGKLAHVRIYGSFQGQHDISELEKMLLDLRHERQALEALLEGVDVASYFGDLSKSDLLDLLY